MIWNNQTLCENLFKKGNSFDIHQFSIQSRSIEIMKGSNNIAATTIDGFFNRSYHSHHFCLNFIVLVVLNLLLVYIKSNEI